MIRSTSRLTTLLAVGVLALAGCTGGGDDPSPSPTDQAESQPASDGGAGSTYPTSGSDEGGSEKKSEDCKADDRDQDIPKKAPKADAWPNVNGVGVPVSNKYGPTQRDGEVWSCFAHSPTGALFAASYLQAGITSASVREAYITDDPAVEDGDGDASTDTVMRGFRITSYDDDEATVELVYETSSDGQSGLAAMPVTLHWSDDQWTSTQSDFAAASPHSITGLTGYTQWSINS